jgi:cell division protein FtsN
MAPKDYVKRPQAKKPARKRNARNPRAAHNTVLPWIKISVSLVVVGLFIFGLYRLQAIDVSDNGEHNTGLGSQRDTANAVGSDADNLPLSNSNDSLELEKLPDLPVLGDEEWAYIDSLPDYSVEVDATGPLTRDKDFIMQCGSFRTIDRAQTLRANIAFQGLESRILTSDGQNGLWYRVVLGPYERKRSAERHRHQLRNANVNGCKIW